MEWSGEMRSGGEEWSREERRGEVRSGEEWRGEKRRGAVRRGEDRGVERS